jgi:hypothetical protein
MNRASNMEQYILNGSWQALVNTVKRAAESTTLQCFPELAKRAIQEAEQFAKLSAPTTDAELQNRYFQINQLQARWDNEFYKELLRIRVTGG